MDTEQLTELIIMYEDYVKKGNKILKKSFGFEGSALLALRRGEIPSKGILENEGMSYNFHGAGCGFKFGEIVVEFDYSFGDFVYKGFQSSKLHCFISTYLSNEREAFLKEDLHAGLMQLLDKGIISKKSSSSYDTYDFILNRHKELSNWP